MTPTSRAFRKPPASGLIRVLSGLALEVFALGFLAADAAAAKLQPRTVKAWDQYLFWADQKVQRELSHPNRFLIIDNVLPQERAELLNQLRSGSVVTRQMTGVVPPGTSFKVPDGAIHHWWGSIMVPGISLADLLRLLKDYDHHAGRFAEIEQSRLIAKNGENYKFFFRLRRTKPPVTVYYNTEQECSYVTNGHSRASSRSVATKIAELQDADTSKER